MKHTLIHLMLICMFVPCIHAMELSQEETEYGSVDFFCHVSLRTTKNKLDAYLDTSKFPENVQQTLDKLSGDTRMYIYRELVRRSEHGKKNFEIRVTCEELAPKPFTYTISRAEILQILLKLDRIHSTGNNGYTTYPTIGKYGQKLIEKYHTKQFEKLRELKQLKKTVKTLEETVAQQNDELRKLKKLIKPIKNKFDEAEKKRQNELNSLKALRPNSTESE